MDNKELKTSWPQRIVIIVIALLLVGSIFLSYIFIVLSNNNNDGSETTDDAKIAKLTEEYDAKSAEVEEAAKPLSEKYFKDFSKYKANTKAYNANDVQSAGLKTKDLKAGTGKTLAEDDKNYLAYYIGWCPDGTIFDSSFNDNENPTSLKTPIDGNIGLIDGWEQGVIGMKLGGVRELDIPGELAYGETKEICGTTNSPLKFIVQAIEPDETLAKLNKELDDLYLQLYYAYYGNQVSE